MKTETELTEAEQRGQQIERHGHQALYGHHECPECRIYWRCRKTHCKREQESLCKSCETKILVAGVQTVGARLHRFLYDPIPSPSQDVLNGAYELKIYESVKQELRLQVDGLVQQARLVEGIE